jgi:G3E family GTPase
MNATAPIHRTTLAQINLNHVLGIEGFSLQRALEVDPEFLAPEYPFEWAGLYQQPRGRIELVIPSGPDHSMIVALLPLPQPTFDDLKPLLAEVSAMFSAARAAGEALVSGSILPTGSAARLELSQDPSIFVADVEEGAWALLTEHRPEEFGAALCNGEGCCSPVSDVVFKAAHEHDASVSSVGLSSDRAIDLDRFNAWMQDLLLRQGPDLFRTKGVLSFDGHDQRFVFQGVHMLVEGRPDAPWGDAPRTSKMVFIGRNLDRAELDAGFSSCLV